MRTRSALLGLLPALVVTALLVMTRDSAWPAVLVYHVLCLGLPTACGFRPREAGLTGADARGWTRVALTLSVALLAAGELGRRLRLEPLLPAGWQGVLALAHPWWMFVAYSIVVNAFAEEYLWRGFFLPRTGVAWGAVLFWLMHAAAASVFVGVFAATWLTLPTFLAGLAWGWMRQRYGSLWPAILTHLAADVAILRAATMLVRIYPR